MAVWFRVRFLLVVDKVEDDNVTPTTPGARWRRIMDGRTWSRASLLVLLLVAVVVGDCDCACASTWYCATIVISKSSSTNQSQTIRRRRVCRGNGMPNKKHNLLVESFFWPGVLQHQSAQHEAFRMMLARVSVDA